MSGLHFYSRTRARRLSPEAALQMTVCEHMRLRGVPGLIYFHPCNEGKRTEAAGRQLKRMGMLPGVADLVLIARGLPVSFLELKARGKTLSEEQVHFATICQAAGARYAVADNIDDALRILEQWGVIARSAATRRAQLAADEQRRAG